MHNRSARRIRRHAAILGGLCSAMVLLAGASAGWACLPQSALLVEPLNSGPVGMKATVHGYRFSANPVEVRWNALDGPLLGTGTGPDFVADVTIPPSPAGLNTLVAFTRNADGSVGTNIQIAGFNVSGDESARTEALKPAAHVGAPSRTASWWGPPVLLLLGGALMVGMGLGTVLSRRRTGRSGAGEPSAA